MGDEKARPKKTVPKNDDDDDEIVRPKKTVPKNDDDDDDADEKARPKKTVPKNDDDDDDIPEEGTAKKAAVEKDPATKAAAEKAALEKEELDEELDRFRHWPSKSINTREKKRIQESGTPMEKKAFGMVFEQRKREAIERREKEDVKKAREKMWWNR